MMKYKGYVAHVAHDDEAKLFHGEVLGLEDVITFQGTSVKDLVNAFHDSVDDYPDWSKERGDQLKNESLNNLIINKLSK